MNVFSNEPFAVTSSESCWPTVMVPSAEMLFGRNAKGRHGMYRKSMRAWKSLWSGMPSVTVPLACPLALPLDPLCSTLMDIVGEIEKRTGVDPPGSVWSSKQLCASFIAFASLSVESSQ